MTEKRCIVCGKRAIFGELKNRPYCEVHYKAKIGDDRDEDLFRQGNRTRCNK